MAILGQDASRASRGPVSWRSVALGLFGAVFVGVLTPYNNFVLMNTDFIGNHLPASVLVFYLLFVMVVNGLLWKYSRRGALGSGEMAVALGMTIVAAALPSVGLMRYLPGHLISFFHQSGLDAESANLMRQMGLPDWLWPTFQQTDPAARGNEPVVTEFVTRTYVEDPTFWNRVVAVPWRNWIQPAISWGIFFSCLAGAVLSSTLVFRRQWVENEKLPFPLASVYMSLIEQPEEGQALNKLLRARWFWISFAVVFALHAFGGLSTYDPRHWPKVPLGYNLNSIFADDPWRFTTWGFKSAKVFFTIIGVMFFVPGRIAFSLWFFYLMSQVVRMSYGTYQAEFTDAMAVDQMFGTLIVLGVVILWVARRHLLEVIKQMFGRAPSAGRYLPDGVAGWLFVVSVAGLVTWVTLAGATIVGAVVVVGVLLLVYTVLAKVVAETGLLYVLLPVPAERLWLYASDLTGGAARTTLKSVFFSNWFFGMFQHDTRESLPVFASHAVRVADELAYPEERKWKRAFPFVMALALALAVSFAVSGASTIYTHYSYATTINYTQEAVGRWGAFEMPRDVALGMTKSHVPPREGPPASHSRVGHFVGGAAFTTLLATMNLRFAAWPLHPVGYLLSNTWGLHCIWFSIMLGWLCKTVVVKYGGAQLYRASRPVFIGLIFGEAAAVAFWLCLSLIMSAQGGMYRAVQILPY